MDWVLVVVVVATRKIKGGRGDMGDITYIKRASRRDDGAEKQDTKVKKLLFMRPEDFNMVAEGMSL